MSPFDQNIDNDAGHTIDQDDLIAFHLHELSPPQERALRRVLQTSPSLQSESVAIASTLRAFPKYEAALPLDAATRDRHWQALRPSLTPHIPPPIAPRSLFPRSIFHHWGLPALAGSALVTTALLVSLHHDRRPSPITVATTRPPTSTAPSIPPATPFNTAPSSGPTLTASTQIPLTINRDWPHSSTPLETEIAQTSQPALPAQLPAPITSPKSSSTIPETPATEAAISPPSNPVPAQPPAQPPTPSAIQPGTSLRTSAPHHSPSTELTLALFGDLTASRPLTYTSGTGTSAVTESSSQAGSPAIGALASFRQQLRPLLGYRVTATYTSPSFESAGMDTHFRIYEFSGTYVVQGPHHRRLTTSAEAGASLLDFLFSTADYYPSPPSNSHVLRGAGVVGVGTEYALTKHWGLRAEYRALVYKPPTFSYTSGSSSPPSSLTFSSNPIVGITYHFGATGSD